MKNKAYVKEVSGGKAVILVKRECMCQKTGGCEAKCFGIQSEIIEAVTENDARAEAGDFVEVEAKGSAILLYSAIVFILPVFTGLFLYFIAGLFTENIILPYAVSAAGFVLSVGFLYFFLNNIVKGRNDFKITKIL
ncbi:MAG: SoxR reducing system RseC family protein [Oscillospiraceae bacterium]|nr:SoxR reducing system RseC family protein [Oscillospiraceae bacterium]